MVFSVYLFNINSTRFFSLILLLIFLKNLFKVLSLFLSFLFFNSFDSTDILFDLFSTRSKSSFTFSLIFIPLLQNSYSFSEIDFTSSLNGFGSLLNLISFTFIFFLWLNVFSLNLFCISLVLFLIKFVYFLLFPYPFIYIYNGVQK